jgi:hypothetical protein
MTHLNNWGIGNYIREKSRIQFAEHNTIQQANKDLAELERDCRTENRKVPADDRSHWFNISIP